MRYFFDVALPLPRLAPLTYEYIGPIEAGVRVLVQLGNRLISGTVLNQTENRVNNVKQIVEVLDEIPAFSKETLELAEWMADYYLCSIGEVLESALPTGLSPKSVVTIEVLKFHTDHELEQAKQRAPKRFEVLAFLQENTKEIRLSTLQRMFGSSVVHQLDALQRAGVISLKTEVESLRGPRTVKAVRLHPRLVNNDEELRSTLDELDKRAPKQSLILGHLYVANHQQEPPTPIVSLQARTGVSASVIDGLVQKQLAEIVEVEKPSDDDPFDTPLSNRNEGELVPTPEQQHAINAISSASGFSRFLLHGVTGSGKTLVYMRSIQHVVDKGLSALVLVPEISLTPQLHDRFSAVFGNNVAVLHSRLSVGERISLWHKIRKGDVKLVIGARSAVFAPIPNLGLIVVDEEHEGSYKQDDPAPRYHARDTAIMRAQICRCPVVLGSATPSLESLHNVAESKYQLLSLPTRADGALMPETTLINLREQKLSGTSLSTTLVDAIKNAVANGDGAILFLNRRGFSIQVLCEDCGSAPMCPNCDVSLTWHKQGNQLRCHYCGHREPMHTSCTTCGSMSLSEQGLGTQQVEEDIRKELRGTGAVVERMDADTTRKKGAHRHLLERFAGGDIDVLVGTQMVAKGLDIARVSTVGIINADSSLYHSGFRSVERTAQLITQVSGRAGRTAAKPGRVFVQTYNPDHPAICSAEWTTQELELRKEFLYPPFARFISIEFSAPKLMDVEHVAEIFNRLIPENHPSFVRFAPFVPPIGRIRNRYRMVMVIKNRKSSDPSGSKCRGILQSAIQTYYREYAVSAVRVAIDIDASGVL